MSKKKAITCTMIGLLWSTTTLQSALAGGEELPPHPTSCYSHPENPYYILLSLGSGIMIRRNKPRDIELTSTITNRYVPTQTTSWAPLVGVGFGQHFKAAENVYTDIGLSAYYLNFGRQHGTVLPAYNIDPYFNTLKYKFNSQSTLLYAESRWFLTEHQYKPYFYLGMGIAWNYLFHYRESTANQSNGAASTNFLFDNHRRNTFSCGLGFGFSHFNLFKPKWILEYRYLYLGNSELGQAPLQTTARHLKTGILQTHLIIFSLYIK